IRDGINFANPTPNDLAKMQGLVTALNNARMGSYALQGANADRDAANAQLGADVATPIAAAGKAAGKFVEGEVLPGSGGTITTAIYGLADGSANGVSGAVKKAASDVVTNAAQN